MYCVKEITHTSSYLYQITNDNDNELDLGI